MPFCSPYSTVQENVVILFWETLLVRVIAILSLLYKKGSSGPGVEPFMPQGMPAWGAILPPEAIWTIVSFIQSLGGTFPASFYYQAWDGDRPGELVAPELAGANKQPGNGAARQPLKEQNTQ